MERSRLSCCILLTCNSGGACCVCCSCLGCVLDLFCVCCLVSDCFGVDEPDDREVVEARMDGSLLKSSAYVAKAGCARSERVSRVS